MDVILVGGGHRGSSHLGAWPAAGGRVVVCVETDDDARQRIAARGVAVRESLADALAGFPDAALVDICTPPSTHRALVLEALAADRNVLCEKPFVLDLAEAEEVRVAASKSRGRVAVMHNYLGEPTIRSLRRRVVSGAIGEVFAVQCNWLEAHGRDTQGMREPEHWVHSLGGGRLEETLPHIVYTLVSLLGDTTLTVQSTTFSKRTPYAWVTADTLTATLTGEKGTAGIYLSFGVEHDHITFTAIGSRGHLEACLDTRVVDRAGLKWNDRDLRDPIERVMRLVDGVANRLVAGVRIGIRTLRRRREPEWLMAEVARCIENGLPMPVSLDEAIATVRITREICDQVPATTA